MRRIDSTIKPEAEAQQNEASPPHRALDKIRTLARRLLGQTATPKLEEEEAPQPARLLVEYFAEPAYGPGKGVGSHSVLIKGGAVIDGKTVHKMPLSEWQRQGCKSAILSDGREIRLNELMTDEVEILTRGIGAER